jgi:dihydropteroate synthase
MTQVLCDVTVIDQELSKRHIDLDPGGYFIIYIDQQEQLIYAKHYTNTINEQGLACDPETGKPFLCGGKLERSPSRIYSGRTAKELCVRVFEQAEGCLVTRFDHAAYLGREFQRAEAALLNGQEYIQD